MHARLRVFLSVVGLLWICLGVGERVSAAESFQLSPYARFVLGMEFSYLWPMGDFLIPAGGRPGSGSRVGLDDLGVGATEGASVFLCGRIVERHFLDAEYLSYSLTGLKNLTKTFRFHNKTYVAGETVETRLDMDWARLTYGYRVVDLHGWAIVPRIGAHYVANALTVNGMTKEEGTYSNTRALDGVFPVLGLEAKYFFPLGAELSLQLEGMHMITRGGLATGRFTALWEVIPDLVLTVSGSNRTAQYQEDHQRLNNEWFQSVFALTAGVGFTF
ncbi:MAG: hypothetical protein FJ118_02040 [Deltaproteobacteria bacterium]|nr:hypothetical protein [Deltaproteobacteria bacterium]